MRSFSRVLLIVVLFSGVARADQASDEGYRALGALLGRLIYGKRSTGRQQDLQRQAQEQELARTNAEIARLKAELARLNASPTIGTTQGFGMNPRPLPVPPVPTSAPLLLQPKPNYLGTLYPNGTAGQYSPNSVTNPFGTYGSPYAADSLANPYGKYGSPYSSYSWRNPYTAQAPMLIGEDGAYLGRLSTNPYAADSTANPYGKYGNPFGNTITNPYSTYGNPYSSKKVFIFGDE